MLGADAKRLRLAQRFIEQHAEMRALGIAIAALFAEEAAAAAQAEARQSAVRHLAVQEFARPPPQAPASLAAETVDRRGEPRPWIAGP